VIAATLRQRIAKTLISIRRKPMLTSVFRL